MRWTLSSASTLKSTENTSRRPSPSHQHCGDRWIALGRGGLRVRDRDQLRLLVSACRLSGGAGLAVERQAVCHRLEVGAEIDEDRPSRSTPASRLDGQEARPHVAARDIGLHHDRVAIGSEHPPAELQRMAEVMAAQIRPDADLRAEPVRLDEPAAGEGGGSTIHCPSRASPHCGRRQAERPAAPRRSGTCPGIAQTANRPSRRSKAVQAGERGRGAAAEIGDAIGQRPYQRAPGSRAGQSRGRIVELDRREGEAAAGAFVGDLGEFQREVGRLREVGGDLQRALGQEPVGNETGAAGGFRLVDQHQFAADCQRSAQITSVRLEAAAHLDVEQECLAALGVGGACLGVHALPGRGDRDPRRVRTDEGRAGRLLGRHRRSSGSACRPAT